MDTITNVEEVKTSFKNVNYNAQLGTVLIDGQRLIGGNFDDTSNKFAALETGVNYEWGGINDSDITVKYGENDSIVIRGFRNGDFGIIFDQSTTLNKNDIINQLNRDCQVPIDLLKEKNVLRDVPKLQYFDTDKNIRYDVRKIAA